MKKNILLLLALCLLLFTACEAPKTGTSSSAPAAQSGSKVSVVEDGTYTDKESVALYIHTYHKLPSNYITKEQAEKKGWNSHKNALSEVLPGKSIGGDHYGNFGKQLPVEHGIKYTECDIDYTHGLRNAKRIVFSSDWHVYYSEDHYDSFVKLY